MSDTERLCPFKKCIDRDYNGNTGKFTMHERFEVCAGERCMAYDKGPFDKPRCKRMEAQNGA